VSTPHRSDPGSLLPLKPAWFHILLSLRQGAQHGYAIRASAEARSGGAVKLWPATLYGSIRELSEAGAIEALEGGEDPDEDQRRRYYRLTAFGEELLEAEADRMQSLVDAARGAAVAGRA
jgi:DNA-binding PadR family transcriptional regulator